MATLALEVEFLTGVSVAATLGRRDEAEWPPHPDRLFQALVAAWGRKDPRADDERRALEWLEALDPDALSILAPPAHRRDVVPVYVPPNDMQTTGRPGDRAPKELGKHRNVVPALRKNRQLRFFPAVVPAVQPPVLRYVWKLREEQFPEYALHRAALQRLSREVVYLGHPHSLVRVAMVDSVEATAKVTPSIGAAAEVRLPHRGRLQHLEEQYARAMAENRIERPKPSLVTRRYGQPAPADLPGSWFDAERAIVLADAGGSAPALAAFPLVAKRLRDALIQCAPAGALIPTLLSGHDATGRPAQGPHMAIVPLADVGWTHSQGRLMGLALVWPRGVADADRRAVLTLIAFFLKQGGGTTGLLQLGRLGPWPLALDPDLDRHSLRFARYLGPAPEWGTVLPAVLDRHPKVRPGDELGDIVLRACLHIGLPKEALDGLYVEIHGHAPISGAPSAREVWRALPLDSPYRTRPLVHLVLRFARPVRGPLLLGAGRYRGLGLCLPLSREGPVDDA